VSTNLRSSILNVESLAVSAVGKQSTRSGLFGATYHPHLPGFFFASRPALRIWLAEDVTGNVLRTLPFAFDRTGESFGTLHVFGINLVSVSESTLLFLDLESVKITQAVRDWQSIRQVAVCGDVCFVCCNNGSLFSVGKPQRLLKKMSSIISQLVQPAVVSASVAVASPQASAPPVSSVPAAAALVVATAAVVAAPVVPFDARAVAASSRVCGRCNDAWRGISLDNFSPPEQDLTLLQNSWNNSTSKPPPQYYAAILCVHVLLQVFAFHCFFFLCSSFLLTGLACSLGHVSGGLCFSISRGDHEERALCGSNFGCYWTCFSSS
jgi:hypothetical protein